MNQFIDFAQINFCQLQWAAMPNDFCFALHHALKTHLLDMSYRIERARLKRFSEGKTSLKSDITSASPSFNMRRASNSNSALWQH